MMLVHFTKQNLTQKIVEIKSCIHEIEDISKKSKSLVVYFIYIRTQLFFHEILGDNASINKTTDIYLKNYTKRFTSILSDTYLNTIHIYKLKSLFHLRTYADALSLVKEINIKAKGASFLAIKEFEIKCYLNQTQEEKTKDLIHHIQIHPSFKNSTLVLKERWVVYNAFAEFIEGIARRARKYNGNLITGTQSIDDYYKNPAALAAIQNTDWICLLAQKKESIEAMKESDRIKLDPAMEKALTSLRMVNHQYSEVMIYGSGIGWSIGRLILDPYSIALYSSKGSDVAKIQSYQSQGYSLEDSIEKVANQIQEGKQ